MPPTRKTLARWLRLAADRLDSHDTLVRSDAEAQAMLEQVVIRGTDGAVVVRDGACTACGAPVGFVRSDGTGQVAVYHEADCPYGGGRPLGASRLYDAHVED